MRPLRVAVCIKPIPDQKRWADLNVDPDTKVLRREGVPAVINPLCRRAIEEALVIRERSGGEVTVISMAPPAGRSSLVEALSMGADRAILLSDRSFAGADTLATSYVLSLAIKKLGPFDLILCGNQTLDGSTGQVGPQLAKYLDIPSILFIEKIDFMEDDRIRVKQGIEEGYLVVEARMPLLLSVVREINTPRYITFAGLLEAEEKEIQVWTCEDLQADPSKSGLKGSPTHMGDWIVPSLERRKEMIQGGSKDAAKKLVSTFYEIGIL